MAARGINKAIIVGTVGQDPELRYAANGSAVVNVSVATNESWNDKNTGEKIERTEWHRIVMFGKLGEIAAQYLKKGSQAYFEGKIHTRKWQDNEGKDRYSTEITANEMQMLGSKGDSGSTGRSAPPSPTPLPTTGGNAPGGGSDPFLDEVPFQRLDDRCA